MSVISDRVKAIIAKPLRLDESELSPDDRFLYDLGFDELDFIELIMELEKQFNIAIPDDSEIIATVGQAIEYIEKNAPAYTEPPPTWFERILKKAHLLK